jgi:Fungal specific transcription factor domain
MHHFTAITSQTFSDTEAQKMAWQIDIPSLAYDEQCLMDAILAVSALHLRSLQPGDQALIRASHGYMASALAQYSSLLNSGVSAFNAEALFSTSALIAFQASASRRFDEDGGYTLPLAWFHSFQGVKTVVMTSWQWLRTSDRIYPIINGQPALALNLDPERKSFFAPLLDGMEEQVETLPERQKAETRQAYEHAVAFLNWSHQRPIRARILGFAATVSRRFVELLSEQDPRALVIASCFFALTKVVDDVWWLQGIAKKEVNGICSLLPSSWWPRMEWPLRIANHEGPMDEETWGHSVEDDAEVKFEPLVCGDVRDHIDMLAQIMNEQVPPLPPD